ncbi:Hypothetical protein A7982_02759 [Minicystis rosea]|nr:Hypothetical protein A7982_02759 [Minicystis rosea]
MNLPRFRGRLDSANPDPDMPLMHAHRATDPSKPPPKRAPAEDDNRYERASALAEHAPMPARVGHVLAGTAGWTDPSLIKSHHFYPPEATSAENRLRFYSSQFPLVEVDSSYYALPSRANAERWVERTPDGFTFDIKAFAPLTQHPVEPARLPSDLKSALPEEILEKPRVYPKDLPDELMTMLWERFVWAIEPLARAGRLGCVLLQFPPWFAATQHNARYIEECRTRLGHHRMAVELRHASWGERDRLARLAALLRDIEASYVIVDEPQGKRNSMPPAVIVADPRLAVVRFHGRRSETWGVRASVMEKYDYIYDREELDPWARTVERLAEEAREVHTVFNNCVSNYAVLGAKGLMALVAGNAPRRLRTHRRRDS